MFSACEKNGLVAEGDDVRGAIERGLNDGFAHPHADLPDRRTKAARQRRDSTQAWKNLLPTEIYHLQRVHPNGQHASLEAAKDVISVIEREGHVIDKLDGYALGRLLHVTTEEWKAIGVMFDRHPSRFRSYDSTRQQIDEYLASVREAKKPARASTLKSCFTASSSVMTVVGITDTCASSQKRGSSNCRVAGAAPRYHDGGRKPNASKIEEETQAACSQVAKPPPPMRINSNALLIGRRRSNRAISVSSMSCSYGPNTRQQDGADNMSPTENVAIALFNHLGKMFEQDFDVYMDWSEIDESRRTEWRRRAHAAIGA
jgi:hypothetical protein